MRRLEVECVMAVETLLTLRKEGLAHDQHGADATRGERVGDEVEEGVMMMPAQLGQVGTKGAQHRRHEGLALLQRAPAGGLVALCV